MTALNQFLPVVYLRKLTLVLVVSLELYLTTTD